MAEQTPARPTVWLIRDSKPGHQSQLRGLAGRLKALAQARVEWLDQADHPVPLWRALLGLAPASVKPYPHPDLIVGAGTATHRLLLATRRLRGARSLVLMRPGFPLWLIDGAIIPHHDNPPDRPDVLATTGVINPITPLAEVTRARRGLILVGGPSRHFRWADDEVLRQILTLVAEHGDWQWVCSGSRRTPETLAAKLARLPSIEWVDHRNTHEHWLQHRMAASGRIWVTPDSASMVYEAVTSGVPTAVFRLEPEQGSRVARGIAQLRDQGRIGHFDHHAEFMAHASGQATPLWEADRAARWVLDHVLGGQG